MDQLFRDLLHEMMYSTDDIFDRYRDSHEDGVQTNNHTGIYNHVDYETGKTVPFTGDNRDNLYSKGPIWGIDGPVKLIREGREPAD